MVIGSPLSASETKVGTARPSSRGTRGPDVLKIRAIDTGTA
jgi:hypothetical protein